MRNVRFAVAVLALLSVCSLAGAQVFSEDFESYAVGTDLHHVGGWDGWTDTASASAPVSDDFAYSGSKSVEILGTTDLVQIFDAAGGQWEFKAMMYIPSGSTGITYFIMLNTYSHNGTQDWSVQIPLDLDAGTLSSYYVGGSLANVVYDRWVEVKMLIDLDNNTVDEYYDGEFLATHQWDDNNHGTLQCLDLFGNGASSVYYDDITLSRIGTYEPSKASNPDPADGADGVVNALLRWAPGDTAGLHNVYLGTSAELTEADLVAPSQLFTMYFHMAGLEPGTTYYWRIDEIEADMTTIHTGEVWSFTTTPLTAHSPDPGDGYKWALPDVTLSWQAGRGASSHELYFGSDADAVASRDASVLVGELSSPSHEAGTLEQETTYYWAVDEIDDGGVTHTGDVWTFTTLSEIPVTDPDLIGWWTLDEGMGATAVDLSGYGEHATIVDNPQWIVTGYERGALQFDGREDYLYTPLAPAMPSQTVCVWVRVDAAPASILGWSNAHPTHGTHDRELYVNADGTVTWRIYTDATNAVTSGRTVRDGHWHHLAGVYTDEGTTELYLDGVSQGSNSASGIYNAYTSPHLTVGIDSQQNRYLTGAVDDVRVYDKALSEAEIAEIMRGNPLLAGSPQPPREAMVDIRDATSLSWSRGETAVSHDVYLGTDRDAVAAAGKDAAEYQGNQPGTSFSLAGLVEFGGGEYCWRVDEVEADGTVHAGCVWRFTVPGYLIVDNFESYSNEVGQRVFEVWIDGVGFTQPEPGNPGNGTSAAVGHDIWTPGTRYTAIMETARVHGGAQAMPLYYDNTATPYYSETERTWTTAQNWTVEGVNTLSLWVRGRRANSQEDLYVAVEDSSGHVSVVVNPDPAAVLNSDWEQWNIALSDLTDAGVNPAAVRIMSIGVGSRTAPTVGGSGVLSIDEIRVIAPASGEDTGQ